MKLKIYTPIIVLFLVVLGVYLYINPEIIEEPQPEIFPQRYNHPKVSNFDFYQIHELNQKDPTSGKFNTEGYVVKFFSCPCPENLECTPCIMQGLIAISENNQSLPCVLTENQLLETCVLTEKEMVVMPSQISYLELGKKYRFSIEFSSSKHILNCKSKSTGEFIVGGNGEIIGYEEIE